MTKATVLKESIELGLAFGFGASVHWYGGMRAGDVVAENYILVCTLRTLWPWHRFLKP